MSKYKALWEFIKSSNKENLKLSFDKIQDILGFEIDHFFLKCKKELEGFGYKVEKISLKEKYVIFSKL